jgi:hypothetical protein
MTALRTVGEATGGGAIHDGHDHGHHPSAATLQASVIAPFEEAADSKIAVKHSELQHALQSQAKLNAVHASQRTQQRHETIGTQPQLTA